MTRSRRDCRREGGCARPPPPSLMTARARRRNCATRGAGWRQAAAWHGMAPLAAACRGSHLRVRGMKDTLFRVQMFYFFSCVSLIFAVYAPRRSSPRIAMRATELIIGEISVAICFAALPGTHRVTRRRHAARYSTLIGVLFAAVFFSLFCAAYTTPRATTVTSVYFLSVFWS